MRQYSHLWRRFLNGLGKCRGIHYGLRPSSAGVARTNDMVSLSSARDSSSSRSSALAHRCYCGYENLQPPIRHRGKSQSGNGLDHLQWGGNDCSHRFTFANSKLFLNHGIFPFFFAAGPTSIANQRLGTFVVAHRAPMQKSRKKKVFVLHPAFCDLRDLSGVQCPPMWISRWSL